MHGAGNDFVMIDGRQELPQDRVSLAQALCDRHFGVGADGLIIIDPSEEVDFIMDFYNPDGSQSFCGNGSRCAFAFAQYLGWVSDQATFQAIDGMHQARRAGLGVEVSMHNTGFPEEQAGEAFLHTGSPHAVLLTDDLDALALSEVATPIRHHSAFSPGGTNVNFVQRTAEGIRMRTFERGVEDETLACGTGVTAAALVTAHQNGLEHEVSVETRGGRLKVRFSKGAEGFENIWLEGPTEFVFEGTLDFDNLKRR